MPRMRLPLTEPVHGVLQCTKTHFNREDDLISVRFSCSRCGQALPDLIRSLSQPPRGGSNALWIASAYEGPWWRSDGDILRPTKRHLEERQGAREHARTSPQIGFKRRVRESLANPSPIHLPRPIKTGPLGWRRPGPRWNSSEIRIQPAPDRIESSQCRGEVRVPLSVQCDVK
jgi:hypothetical protein